jgi:hypothetical protein
MSGGQNQQDRALSFLRRQGMARPWELANEGITAATLARMLEKGLILQLSRGLYQLPGAAVDTHHSLAEAAKSVPKGLVSALAFHELTDTIPRSVWMAIGPKDRRPAVTHPPLQIVRFGVPEAGRSNSISVENGHGPINTLKIRHVASGGIRRQLTGGPKSLV